MFCGADAERLREWGTLSKERARTLEGLLEDLRARAHALTWVGPDRDVFLARLQTEFLDRGRAARDDLDRRGALAVSEADEQDAASAADGSGAAGGPGHDEDSSPPGTTEKSGDLIDAPDRLQDDIDDADVIRAAGEDIVQGGIGDCYFLAPLAALAQTDPGFLEEGITFADGRYRVRFYERGLFGPKEVWIDVDPLVAESGVRGADGEITPLSLYETAYAQFSGGYEEIDGGQAKDALYALTGDATAYDREPSVEELRTAVNDGRVVVADTGPREGEGFFEGFPDRDGPVPEDAVSNHVYVVQEVRDDGIVVLQNPWGPDGGYQDGIFRPGELTLTEEEYRETFQNVTIGEVP